MSTPAPNDPTMSTALLTDRYEYTMLDAAVADGTADQRCVFEVFARGLPEGRRFGVVAGIERVVEAVSRFRLTAQQLAWLDDEHIVRQATLRRLAELRFTGDLAAYHEGELHMPGSPIVTVTAPFDEAVLIETVLLSILNYDSAVAAAAARMVIAARSRGDTRSLFEFGGRRTHEQAAIAAARAAIAVGFDATSNLEAGRRYGLATAGTAAHAFILLYNDEAAAFEAQVAAARQPTVLLVDTYDIAAGVDHAIAVARRHPGTVAAIRIDSGELATVTREARQRLDAAGCHHIGIIASGDLDEHRIAELADAPIAGFGVGTSVVTGSGHPNAGLVYKMVARQATDDPGTFRPVAKAGGVKATIGGSKVAFRRVVDGIARAEFVLNTPPPRHDATLRSLQTPVIIAGEPQPLPTMRQIRQVHQAGIDELPAEGRSLSAGPPALPTLRTWSG